MCLVDPKARAKAKNMGVKIKVLKDRFVLAIAVGCVFLCNRNDRKNINYKMARNEKITLCAEPKFLVLS